MTFPYRNCVFDLYGTLVDIHTDEEEPALWADFAAFLRPHGVVLAPEALHSAYLRLCREETLRCREALARAGIPGPEEIDILRIWQALGVSDPRQGLAVSRWFRRRSTQRLRLFDGALEVTARLRQMGCRVWLLSNAQESFTLPELEALGLRDAFDRILISGAFGVRKPSPAFFGRLFTQAERPEDFLMVGNDDLCDCHGAARAGMDSLYIATEQSPPRTRPLPANCREIASLRDIPTLSAKLSMS